MEPPVPRTILTIAHAPAFDPAIPARSGTRLWRWATYTLALTVLVLSAFLLSTLRSSPSPEVHLYNAWLQQTRLVAQSAISLQQMQLRNREALGMAEAATAMFGYSGSTAATVAADLSTISGSLNSMLVITQERRTLYPRPASSNLSALRRLLTQRVLRQLPSSVDSADQLRHALPTLNTIVREVRAAASTYGSNVTAQP